MEIRPKYTVKALKLYYEITGEDLMFGSGQVDTPLKRSAFMYVGVNAGSGDHFKSFDEVDELDLKVFTEYFTLCLHEFSKTFEVSKENVEENESLKKN